MSDGQLRTEIGRFLAVAGERLISAVYAMMKSYLEHDRDIVGFTTEGKPLTKDGLFNGWYAYNVWNPSGSNC